MTRLGTALGTLPPVAQDLPVDPIRARLRSALTAAMKERDPAAVSAIRAALAAIDNAESVDGSLAPAADSAVVPGAVQGLGAGEVPRRELAEGDIVALVRAEVDARGAAAAEYDQLGQEGPAAQLRAEAAALAAILRAGESEVL
jgi:uncharacterized protein YqeY